MACGADPVGVAMVDGEEGVIGRRQCRREPCCCGVAGCARCRPARRSVIWIGGSCVVGLMAGVAGGRRPGKDIIDVAEIAGHSYMRTSKREGRAVVIERRTSPACCGVAGIARSGEARSSVLGICGPVVIRRVAPIAGGRQGCVVVVGVAGCAGYRRMCTGEREGRGGVIECR